MVQARFAAPRLNPERCGTIKKDGSVSYRGAIYYQTSSTKWSRLNSVAAIFDYEVDAEGSTRAQIWEWK